MNLSNFHRNVPLSFYKKSVKSIYLPSYPTRTKVQYYCFHEIFSEFYFTVCKCTHHSDVQYVCTCENEKFTFTERFRQIKYLVISLAKLLLSRNCCQKSNIHTPQMFKEKINIFPSNQCFY